MIPEFINILILLKENIIYVNDEFSQEKIMWIFKARCDLIILTANEYGARDEDKYCKICNLHQYETLQHFIGICPAFREFRRRYFMKPTLLQTEVISILEDHENRWSSLVKFLKYSLAYRKFLTNEFN